MSMSRVRRFGACVLVTVIASLMLAGNQVQVFAGPPPGIYVMGVMQLDCAHFRFEAQSISASGYAAVRIWVNNPNGTPLVDSYIAGYPSEYAPLNLDGGEGFAVGGVSFTPQPLGTVLYARVYRALTAAPGSWDGQTYQDSTATCQTGINFLWSYSIDCSEFQFAGSATPGWGYAAVRIWPANGPTGTPLVDSFVAGYPSYYIPVQSDGTFSATITFPHQPTWSPIYARVYWAPNALPQSWEGVFISKGATQCYP